MAVYEKIYEICQWDVAIDDHLRGVVQRKLLYYVDEIKKYKDCVYEMILRDLLPFILGKKKLPPYITINPVNKKVQKFLGIPATFLDVNVTIEDTQIKIGNLYHSVVDDEKSMIHSVALSLTSYEENKNRVKELYCKIEQIATRMLESDKLLKSIWEI